MDNRAYCPICEKDTILKIRNEHRTVYIDGLCVDYTADFGYCTVCDEEVFVEELSDREVMAANKRYRELTEIITTEEIEEILEKYDISGHYLSLLLGWSDRTVDRYKKGKMPTPEYSKRLKALASPINMYEALEQGKRNIPETIYAKLKHSIERYLGAVETKKPNVFSVASYFIKKSMEEDERDISPLKLQKLVYYAHAWFLTLKGRELSPAGFEAWRYGPVNRELYDALKVHKSEILSLPNSFETFHFDEETVAVLELVRKAYGCFSATYLSNMSHREAPWQNARKGFGEHENCEAIISSKDMETYYRGTGIAKDEIEVRDLVKYIEKIGNC